MDPEGGECLLRPGPRPPVSALAGFIDSHAGACPVLIASRRQRPPRLKLTAGNAGAVPVRARRHLDNILLAGRRVIVADFGIARILDATTQLTGSGTLIGTPQYMAPEHLDGGAAGPPADKWALGATLYTAVEGSAPFAAANLTALIGAIRLDPGHANAYNGLGAVLRDMKRPAEAEAAFRRRSASIQPIPTRAKT
jgi:serine/threonine protein kinase